MLCMRRHLSLLGTSHTTPRGRAHDEVGRAGPREVSSQLAGRAAVEEQLAVEEGLIGHAVPQAGIAVRVVPPQRVQQPSALAVARVGLFQVGVQGHKPARMEACLGWGRGPAAEALYGKPAIKRPSTRQVLKGQSWACSILISLWGLMPHDQGSDRYDPTQGGMRQPVRMPAASTA